MSTQESHNITKLEATMYIQRTIKEAKDKIEKKNKQKFKNK